MADTVLKALETNKAEERINDGDSLYFVIKGDGKKRWEFRYKKPNGKWSWLGLGGYPDALFPLEPDNEILNRIHPFYSPKLALIVETWQQLKYAELNNQTVKKYIEDWIRDNAIKYEFNNMGETSISNLTEIVNFEKGGEGNRKPHG